MPQQCWQHRRSEGDRFHWCRLVGNQPPGAGVQIVANSNVGYYPQQQGPMALFEWLVQASPQCTGS